MLILTLQRYLIEGFVPTPFSMREIGTVIALLYSSDQPQDLICIEGVEG
jgi:deoxyinosine 3'endonuclease (endonuclease V)